MPRGPRPYRPTLVMYVLWHPRFAAGTKIARALHGYFARDPLLPAARGIGIPVRCLSGPASSAAPTPPPIPFAAVQRAAVVVLVEESLASAEAWAEYLAATRAGVDAAPDAHRLYPILLSQGAAEPRSSWMRGLVPIPAVDRAQPETLPAGCFTALTHELCCQLDGGTGSAAAPPVTCLLSYAEADGEELAASLRGHLLAQHGFRVLSFPRDLRPGADAGRQRREALTPEAALLVIQTDAYAATDPCQEAVLIAKQRHVPIVVVNALDSGEERSSPFLGNLPTVRWQDGDGTGLSEATAGLLLRETLRQRYFRRHVEAVRRLHGLHGAALVLARPPELLTTVLARPSGPARVVYPDPPLPAAEARVVQDAAPQLLLQTPTQWSAASAGGTPGRRAPRRGSPGASARATPDPRTAPGESVPLRGVTVGLSISDPAPADLHARGLSEIHLNDAFSLLALHLLAQGATLAYGGDHRVAGFTHVLLDLVRAYEAKRRPAPERILNYLAWPLDLEMNDDMRTAIERVATVRRVPLPADLAKDPTRPVGREAVEDRYVRARCLSEMRRVMTAEIDARILLGGRVEGFQGVYPGLAEEALFALRAGKPLYLLGGFGGCAAAVVRAVQGEYPDELSEEAQRADARYADLFKFHNLQRPAKAQRIDYAAMGKEFANAGVTGLRNGLSAAQNARLFATDDVEEAIALILAGLRRSAQPPRRRPPRRAR